MKLWTVISGCVLVTVCGIAQTRQGEPRVSLDVLVEGLGDPDLVEVPVLIQEIQRRGIDFDLNKQLGAVLSAGAKGKRDPEQMAILVTSCWDACELCRARFLAPMTTEELKNLLKSSLGPQAVFQEV